VEAKYDSTSGGWCSKEVMGSFGVGVWIHMQLLLLVLGGS
jgi:hypothetical protein